MLVKLLTRLMVGAERTLVDSRAQIKASRVNRQIIVYRYGGVQFWYDLDAGLRSWCMTTNAEVRAYNLLVNPEEDGHFIKSGPTVYYKKGDQLWKSCDWKL
jgi:hypothetical protein